MVGSAERTKAPPPLDIAALDAAYRVIDAQLGLCAEQTERNARHMMSVVDRLLDEGPSATALPGIAALLAFLMRWIDEYESANVAIPDSSPAELLRHLMDVNGLRQSDLSRELGGQSVVSEILNGKRKINLRQAQALAIRFCVAPAVFVERQPAHLPELLTTDSSSPAVIEKVFGKADPNNVYSPDVLAAFETITASAGGATLTHFKAAAHGA